MRPNKKRTKSLTITLNLSILKVKFMVEWVHGPLRESYHK